MGRILLLGGHARQPKRREPPGPLEPRLLERGVLDPLLQTRGVVQRGLQQTRQGRMGARAASASRCGQRVGRGRRVELQLRGEVGDPILPTAFAVIGTQMRGDCLRVRRARRAHQAGLQQPHWCRALST